MLRRRKHWRCWCGLWKPNLPVCFALSCSSTRTGSMCGMAPRSFAMYYREPRSPSPAETRALELATHLAGIAIERKVAREERERLRQLRADLERINRVTTIRELTAYL